MKKELLGLAVGLVGALALASCANNKNTAKECSYSELSNALANDNYTFKFGEEGFLAVECYDKENKAISRENHFNSFIDREYMFEEDGKVVSVVYSNYTLVDNTCILYEDGSFKYSQSSIIDGEVIDNYFDTGFSLDKLFKDDNNKILSAGVISSPRLGCDERSVEAKNVIGKNGKVSFELDLIEIQDITNHAFDRYKTYDAEIYNLGSTVVNITAEIKADINK